MSTGSSMNFVYKYAILETEIAFVGTEVTLGATSIPVTCKVMTATPFVNGQMYTIMDGTFAEGANGLPNAERFVLIGRTGETATPLADGLGYSYSATLECAALANNYSSAAGVLIPGVEMAVQSADFTCRFKTLSDAPKIDMDDESSRFATGDEGRDKSIAGARSAEISFTEKVAWAGSVTAVPVWDKLMTCMGHLRKTYGSTGQGYLPLTAANEITATVWTITPENGLAPNSICYRYVGAHGGSGSSFGASKIGDDYMLTGKLNAAYIGTQELTITQARALTSNFTQNPEVLLNNICTVPAWVGGIQVSKEVEISQFNLDFGGVVNPYLDQSTSTGNAWYATQDRDPKLTINPYHVRKSLEDVDYVITNEITGELKIQSAQTSPHITIDIFNAQLISASIASREGYMSTERTYRALRNNLGNGAIVATVPDSAMYEILIGARA